jgi:diguanylate cyclase (GGDEF)-like protein
MSRSDQPKYQGFALANSGLVLALVVVAALDAIHFTEVSTGEWGALVAAAAVLLASAWSLLRLAGPLWRGWDPHFVIVPAATTLLLLSVVIGVAPEARTLVLGVWPVVLIFAAGYLGFFSAGALSLLMTVAYLAAVWASGARGVRVEVELLVGGVFLVTSLYSGVVLSRLRRQRGELAEARAELTRLAHTDPLTGLANRRHFDEALAAALSRIARHGGRTSLAIIDLDHFKAFNDDYGHPAGDAALRHVASLLRERVGPHDVVARLGGEEFAVLMVGASPEAAFRTAEQIRESVRRSPLTAGAAPAHVSVSIGLATAPEDGGSPTELVREADRALYRAKAAGRDTTMVAGEAMTARVR